jgi:hypothetical protein
MCSPVDTWDERPSTPTLPWGCTDRERKTRSTAIDEQTKPQSAESISAEDIKAHNEHDHIAAVFADREHAEAAVEELRALGLGSEHLGVAVHSNDNVVFEHDANTELLHDVEISAGVGIPVGFLAGIALATLAVPGIAVGGILALAGVGAGWGAFLGSYIGIGLGERASLEHEDIELTPSRPDEVLVVACSHGHADTVRNAMQRHQGRIRLDEVRAEI